jgi:hypothetical protein
MNFSHRFIAEKMIEKLTGSYFNLILEVVVLPGNQIPPDLLKKLASKILKLLVR